MRVLVVQEESAISDVIKRGLLAKGINTDIAQDGEEALWRAREGDYTAIVLDLLLPKMNGYDVCQSMRDKGVRTPILILTAKSGEYDEIEGLELGADDFLRRPYSMDVLTARLHALLRRGRHFKFEDLSSGPLRYDPVSRRCWFREREIKLTSREAQILETLLRSCGKVVAKQTLINRVWGIDFDGTPNIVDVYIGYLRRKIDRIHGQKVFETVHGVGYRLNEL